MMVIECKFWDSYKNPLRTLWKVRKWFKMPKIRIWCYRYYRKKNDDTPLFKYRSMDVSWKPKLDTPRHEGDPAIRMSFFRLFCIDIKFSYNDVYINDSVYEQIIWTLYYNDNDIKKAYRTWPWYNPDTKYSSWDKSMMTKKGLKEIDDVEWDTSLLERA